MNLNGVSRRKFLKAGGASLGAALMRSRAASFQVGANDRIQLGFIGVGGMGMNRLRGFLQHKDVDVIAICDVDSRHRAEAIAEVQKQRGNKPVEFGDFRLLLEENDIDAVVIATPDHWHAIPTVQACDAGKDVFVEKPLSYSVVEGRAMVEAARRNKRVTQMGNHIHNDLPNYRRVVEMVQSGKLGRITRVVIWKTSSTKGFGNPPDTTPPPELDYDFWLGPAPKRPYNPNRSHRTYRHFWDYSGGTFIDFWCHIADVAFWALDLDGPKSVSATGGRFYLNDNTETPDQVEAVFEYPDLTFIYTFHPQSLPGFEHMGGIGCVFQGSEATLVTNYEKHEIWVNGEKAEDFPRPDRSIPDSPGHLREFLDAIRSRKKTTCNIEYGHRLNRVGLLANIAYRTGARILWDNENEKILNSPEASRLLTREFRKPWKL